MDETSGCQGCGSTQFRWIPEWELLMCRLCVIALDYVTTAEREYILEQIYQGKVVPPGWCCWVYQPEVACCRFHGNRLVDETPIPVANRYRGAA